MQSPSVLIAALLLTATALPACTSLQQFNRFFLTHCPESGPTPEGELDIFLPAVNLWDYERSLQTAGEGFSLAVIAEVPYESQIFRIYQATRAGPVGAKRLLVIAGVHGNEVAGALAAARILSDVRELPEVYAGLDLHVIAPANPVGLVRGARYNPQGCDINRDFSAFETIEARAIRDAIVETRPDLVLSLHEGPHDGFFAIATRSTPPRLASAVATAVEHGGMQLATRSNLGLRLGAPGVMHEGWFISWAKWLLRIHSLGAFTESNSIPLLTTEGPWKSSDIEGRVHAQVMAVRAAAEELTSRGAREVPAQ